MVHKHLLEIIPSSAPQFPVNAPGNCDLSYGSTDGPFVAVDAFGTGDRVYVNDVTGAEIATAFGWASPADVHDLHAQIERLSIRVAELKDELAAERADKLVPLAEVIDFVKAREQRRPAPAA